MRTILTVITLLFPVAASAQGTAAQRIACTGDAFKFCSGQIPDVPAITACMRSNYASLTPNCRAQFDKPAKQRGR